TLTSSPNYTLFPYTTLFRSENQYSELPYARAVAKHIGAEYNEVIVGPDDFFTSLPQLIWQEDEQASEEIIGADNDFVIFRSDMRSEEHTSELQSRGQLVCRL